MKRWIVWGLVLGLAVLAGCTLPNMETPKTDPGVPPGVGAGTPVTLSAGRTLLASAGWHLISVLTGCWAGGDLANSITATLGGVTKPLDEAAAAGWLYHRIWDYDADRGTWNHLSVYGPAWLMPENGYWIYTFVPNLVLNFPYEAQFEDVRYRYPQTETGFWQFVNDCQLYYHGEKDKDDDYGHPQLVQGPPITYARMTGDCDDFATMIAYYAQEYWGYDSFVALLQFLDGSEGHAIAYVQVPPDYVNQMIAQCGPDYPYWQQDGLYWVPIDFPGMAPGGCPIWTWDMVDFSTTTFQEWYDVVYESMSVSDDETTRIESAR